MTMRRLPLALLLVLVALLTATPTAEAQTINPTKVAWDYSADEHAQLSKYVFGFWLEGATDPVQAVDILPGQATAIVGGYEAAMPRPVVGRYVAKLQACKEAALMASGFVCSPWSNTTDPFVLTPATPANLRARP